MKRDPETDGRRAPESEERGGDAPVPIRGRGSLRPSRTVAEELEEDLEKNVRDMDKRLEAECRRADVDE